MLSKSLFFCTIVLWLLSVPLVLAAFSTSSTFKAEMYSATVVVTTLVDENDGCDVGDCSLREALVWANLSDTIVFDSDLTGGTITLSDTLVISQPLTIRGNVPITISGGEQVRVFYVLVGPVTFDSLTIADGNADNLPGEERIGTGIRMAPNTAVTLTNSTLSNHRSDNGIVFSAEIDCTTVISNTTFQYNASTPILNGITSTMTIVNSRISDSVDFRGAAAIENYSILRISKSVIERNNHFSSGGIWNLGTAYITNTIISHNTALAGGGLHNFDTAYVTDSIISYNTAVTDEPNPISWHGSGGGIYNQPAATLILSNTEVSHNQAVGGVGGAGIFNEEGVVVIHNSVVSHNEIIPVEGGVYEEVIGGGLANRQGVMTVTHSLISHNATNVLEPFGYGAGGGIHSDGMLWLDNSTVRDNETQWFGGGIDNGGQAWVSNSTISHNQADWISGGIINGGRLTLTYSTITGNTALDLFVEPLTHGGGGISNLRILTLTHTIVSGNTAVVGAEINNDENIGSGNIIHADNYNIIGYGNSARSENFSPYGTDVVPEGALDTVLDPILADNGGTTPTHALVPNSPALDLIPLETCVATGYPSDQRGITRPQGAACDSGAVEMAWYPLHVVTSGDGNGIVTSVPEGIDCGLSCTMSLWESTTVTLTAVAETDATFVGWSGACSGLAPCIITMNMSQTVTATFSLIPPEPTPTMTPSLTPTPTATPLTPTPTITPTPTVAPIIYFELFLPAVVK